MPRSLPLAAVCALVMAGAINGCAARNLRPAPADLPQTPVAAWDYREWAVVLRENVHDGLVNYEHLAAHRENLDKFLGLLSVVGPERRPELFKTNADRAAYWINAYNALVLRFVLERYPIATMYGLGDPSLEADYRFPVDGQPRNLLQVRLLANQSARNDPRVMFCLCAAARGAPPLAPEPYFPLDLERRLRETARQAVGNDKLVHADHVERKLRVWLRLFSRREEMIAHYRRRYRTAGAVLLTVLNTYADSARRSELAAARGYPVAPLPFDRALNNFKPAR